METFKTAFKWGAGICLGIILIEVVVSLALVAGVTGFVGILAAIGL